MNKDKIVRGSEADRLLGSELVSEVLDEMDSMYVKKWRKAQTVDEREEAHRRVVAIEELRARLRSISVSGVEERKRQDKEDN